MAASAALSLLIAFACTTEPLPVVSNEDATLSREAHVPHFPILQGSHAGIGCNDCHGNYASFRFFSCTDCHNHRIDIVGPRHAAVPNFSYTPVSCYRCHPRSERVGVDHDLRFPISAPPAVHAVFACQECHLDPANRALIGCAGSCHPAEKTAGQHVNVAAFIYESRACYACHPTGAQ